ncbi:MAG: ABC transporter permease [Coriobacteriales bacterium]|jgi:ABC-type nitrate/sulfonate/bicarbonate transport system permease component
MRRFLGLVWGTVFVIFLWWLLAVLIDSPALPTPQATWPELVDNFQAIVPDFGVSLARLVLSLAIGTVLGVPLGLAIGLSKRGDEVFGPVLYVLYPVPKVIFLPVLFILFGLGGQAKVILIAIAVFFQTLVSMRDAAKEVPAGALVSLRSLGASGWQCFTNVVVPSTLPALFTSLRISTGTAVAILFIAESMAGSTGLGYFIMHSWSLLEYERMFAGIVAMAVLGVAFYEVFELCEHHATKWRRVQM